MTSYVELPADDPLRPLQKFCENVTYCKTLGMYAHEVDESSVTLALPPNVNVAGDSERGYVHTGAIITLIDSAFGMAVLHKLKANEAIATLDLRVDFLRTASTNQAIYCRAQCYRLTHNVAFVRAEAYCESENMVATAMASFMRLKPVSLQDDDKDKTQ